MNFCIISNDFNYNYLIPMRLLTVFYSYEQDSRTAIIIIITIINTEQLAQRNLIIILNLNNVSISVSKL